MQRPERRGERQRRSKIPLACEPCRERKSRCDGAKPICSTCQRRSLPLHQCIYTLENARTASNEAYIRVLHDRIRRLEDVCTKHGITTPPLESGDGDDIPGGVPRVARPDPLSPHRQRSGPGLEPPCPPRALGPESSTSPVPRIAPASPEPDRLDASESAARVTAMGTVSAEDDACQAFDAANEFYGSSSAASFMKEACTSAKPHNRADPHRSPHTAGVPAFAASFGKIESPGYAQFAQAEKFVLPPRSLADHLLDKFWSKVYWLYPFFHRPTFLRAYENLWRPAHEQPPGPPMPGLGLGSPGADVGTIVFQSAVNTIFALGCQFADLAPKDKALAVETFFNRAKVFVGLDFLDMHNVGVVQGLLLMALLLQSTPFPSRCWNSVGVACRVAQGLGLHTESGRTSRPPLEMEIRRRTWHGCVVLDMIVSMTYGRPTATGHLPGLALPLVEEFDDERGEAAKAATTPSKMVFYVEYIRQCRILDDILSRVYQPSHPGLLNSSDEYKSHGMDAILDLDAKLSSYENALDPTMSWKTPSDISGLDEERRLVIVTQRTVLRGSFLYLRLMLHRPILTRLCADTGSNPSTAPNSPARSGVLRGSQELFNSFAAGCAKICLGAAMDLIELVHSTYLTKTTGGWWWDGLYAFTGGLAVIVAYLCPPLVAMLDRQRLENCWMLCQAILAHFSLFSISAHRSLKLLQRVHADVMSRVSSDKDCPPPTASGARRPPSGDGERSIDLGQDIGPGLSANFPPELGNGFQWQVPGIDTDVFRGGPFFNWDQSIDMITDGLGMEIV
ncbi:hypothetical protein VTK26DRAFT_8564 [Humicola hyalothermophila]